MNKLFTILSIFFIYNLFSQLLPEKYNSIYAELDQYDFDEKLKKIDKLIKKSPNDPWFYWMKGNTLDLKASILGDENDLKDAIKNFEKSISIDPNFDSGYASLARLFRYDENSAQKTLTYALELISKAIQLNQEESYYKIDRGSIFLVLNQIENALQDVDNYLNLKDVDPFPGLELKIKILSKIGNKQVLYKFVSDNDLSEMSDMMDTEFLIFLGSIYEEMNEINKACTLYAKGTESFVMMELEIPFELSEKIKNCK